MKILITGAQGYIGGRLAEWLYDTGRYQLRLFTRYNKMWPFAWYNTSDKLTVDFNKPIVSLADYCSNVDVIVHLAALNDKACAIDPAAAHRVNVDGTAQLLNAAVRAGVKRFIYLSTMHVYGAIQGDIDENSVPQPKHPYALTHLAAERQLETLHKQGLIEGVILRLSNSYGRPAHISVNCWNLLLNDLARQAMLDKRMVLHSSGLQYRDFVPMSFVCDVIERFFTVSTEVIQNPIFNIGANYTVPIRDMVTKLAKIYHDLYGHSVDVEYGQEPLQSNVAPFQFSVARLQQLGIFCKTSIETELSELLQFVAAYKQPLSIE